jgi:hypothetical protein
VRLTEHIDVLGEASRYLTVVWNALMTSHVIHYVEGTIHDSSV